MYIKMLGDKFRPFCGRGKKYLKLFWDLATFKDYPVDEQVCDIEFESWGHTNDQLIFQWHNVDPIKVNQNISLNQHVFQVGTTTKGGHNYSTGKFYTIFKKSIRDNLTTFPLVLKKFHIEFSFKYRKLFKCHSSPALDKKIDLSFITNLFAINFVCDGSLVFYVCSTKPCAR